MADEKFVTLNVIDDYGMTTKVVVSVEDIEAIEARGELFALRLASGNQYYLDPTEAQNLLAWFKVQGLIGDARTFLGEAMFEKVVSELGLDESDE